MSKKRKPRMSIAALIIHVVLIVTLGQILALFTDAYMIIAFTIYATLTISLKKIVPKDLRKGMDLVRAGKFEDAISAFKASLEFFQKKPWIDKYRAVTMLSVSTLSYREMSLINIGFCYSQIQAYEKAKLVYEKVIEEYPNSPVADHAMSMLQEQIKKSQ